MVLNGLERLVPLFASLPFLPSTKNDGPAAAAWPASRPSVATTIRRRPASGAKRRRGEASVMAGTVRCERPPSHPPVGTSPGGSRPMCARAPRRRWTGVARMRDGRTGQFGDDRLIRRHITALRLGLLAV